MSSESRSTATRSPKRLVNPSTEIAAEGMP
jgi:hypothetical protein